MRDQEWLENRMEYLQRKYFSDIKISNPLFIKFGRKAKTHLGSIRKKHQGSFINRFLGDFDTEIIINSHFKDEKIPEYVVDAVIGHELCHYVHGFSSPLPQLSRYPHQGGLVSHEMQERGLSEIEKKQKRWIKRHWLKYLKRNWTHTDLFHCPPSAEDTDIRIFDKFVH